VGRKERNKREREGELGFSPGRLRRIGKKSFLFQIFYELQTRLNQIQIETPNGIYSQKNIRAHNNSKGKNAGGTKCNNQIYRS
jgi:hypothetical protein